MAARLSDKRGDEAIDVTIGDFSTTRVNGSFSLVYLVYNTIGNLTTQDAQVACFRNAAAHLEPGGCFLIEDLIPHSSGSRPETRSGSSARPRGTGGSTSTTWRRRG